MRPEGAEFERLLRVKEKLRDRFLPKAIENDVVGMSPIAPAAAAARAGLHVHAVGIGPKIKEKDGGVTDTMAVRVYVIQKIEDKDIIPQESFVEPEIDGVPTDVIEATPAFLSQAASNCSGSNEPQSIVIGGISTGFEGGPTGTIACFCRRRNGQGVFVLSNRHVFVGGSDLLVQPANSHHKIARLADNKPITFGGVEPNEVDAAIGRLRQGIRHRQEICTVGTFEGSDLAGTQMPVHMHGATSRHTLGVVDDISYDVVVGADGNNSSTMALFIGQIRIKATSGRFAGGDSGSLIVTQGSTPQKAIGLLFSASSDGTYGTANPIHRVLDELQIDLLPPPRMARR
jgi:hypothetical protein